MEEGKLIYEAISKAMIDISAIDKDSRNTSQGFNYRGIDDVYNSLHDILAKHKIFSVSNIVSAESEERATKNGTIMMYEKYTISYRFFTIDGSNVTTVVRGIGMDSGDKAGNKAMAIAHKYALIQLFCIPTKEQKDPDAETPEPIASLELRAREICKKNNSTSKEVLQSLNAFESVEIGRSSIETIVLNEKIIPEALSKLRSIEK